MKKRFVPRGPAKAVDHTAHLYPLTVRSYEERLTVVIPGDVVWFRDGLPIEVEECRWINPEEPYVRLTGTRCGQRVDLLRRVDDRVTVQGKTTHVVRFEGGDRLFAARRWYRLGSMLPENELMVVNDNDKTCRYFNVGKEIEIVKEV